MQTFANRLSRLKDIHDKETKEGYFAASPSGGGGVLSITWGLDLRQRICSSFPNQPSRSAGELRIANYLIIGDAGILVNERHSSSNYWFGNLEFHENIHGSSSNKYWASGHRQIGSAERNFSSHRVGGNILTSKTEPVSNRSPIFAKNRILLSRKGENS
jgi:hypothetical protein